MVGHSEYSIVTAQVWSHGLRIEELRIDEIDVVRRHMHGCRDESARRNDVVELTEGIYQLVLRLVMREGQCSCLSFLESVLNRFGEEQSILQNRAAKTKPRQRVAQAANVPASDAETGNELFQHAAPFFASAFGFYGNPSQAKELGCNPASCTPAMTSTLSVRRSSGTSVNSRSISCPSL